MRTFACLIFIALAYVTQGAPSPHIIDGTDAEFGEFPYQVSLRFYHKHRCSGSIINQFNVLTAANCVVGSESKLANLKVHVGTNYLYNLGDVYDIESVSVHQDYDVFLGTNNVALIHLTTPIIYKTFIVQPINLMISDENLEGKPFTLSGWRTTLNGNTSDSLQKIGFLVYPQKRCATEGWGLTDSQICTSSTLGVCDGDSGGPIMANGIQIGITSVGHMYEPHVHTRLTFNFVFWIMENLKK